jgi:lysozyme family protein
MTTSNRARWFGQLDIKKLIADLVVREGGYSNDPQDAGGETNFGITVAVARRNGYVGPMRSLTMREAARIYESEYWLKPGFNRVAVIFPELGEKLFDFGVNCGVGVAATTLQRCLNALNDGGLHYPDLKVDGDIGPTTASALAAFLARRAKEEGREVLLFMVAAVQGARYLELTERKAQNEKFLFGWERNRALYQAVL